jgi:uncharacterized membrane protein
VSDQNRDQNIPERIPLGVAVAMVGFVAVFLSLVVAVSCKFISERAGAIGLIILFVAVFVALGIYFAKLKPGDRIQPRPATDPYTRDQLQSQIRSTKLRTAFYLMSFPLTSAYAMHRGMGIPFVTGIAVLGLILVYVNLQQIKLARKRLS